MANPKGNDKINPGPGRPKGSKDKLPRDLKERVLAVIAKLDKEKKSLYDIAKKDPKWFYVNFMKPMLPKDVKWEGEMVNEIRVTFVDAE